MPTYEYKCKGCDHRFELFQSMTARPVRVCPACRKPRAQRLIGTGAALLFKGSGFYQTDYRSESYSKAAEADRKAAEPAPAAPSTATPASTAPSAEAKGPSADTPTPSSPSHARVASSGTSARRAPKRVPKPKPVPAPTRAPARRGRTGPSRRAR